MEGERHKFVVERGGGGGGGGGGGRSVWCTLLDRQGSMEILYPITIGLPAM